MSGVHSRNLDAPVSEGLRLAHSRDLDPISIRSSPPPRANPEAAHLYQTDKKMYSKKVRSVAEKSVMGG